MREENIKAAETFNINPTLMTDSTLYDRINIADKLAHLLLNKPYLDGLFGISRYDDTWTRWSSAREYLIDEHWQLIALLGERSLLSSYGATITWSSGRDATHFLHFATLSNNIDFVKYAVEIEKGSKGEPKENKTTCYKATCLHLAAFIGSTELIQYFLNELNFNLEERTSIFYQSEKINGRRIPHGMTPLHCAVFGGHLNAVKLLIELGADVQAKTSEGYSVLSLIPPSLRGTELEKYLTQQAAGEDIAFFDFKTSGIRQWYTNCLQVGGLFNTYVRLDETIANTPQRKKILMHHVRLYVLYDLLKENPKQARFINVFSDILKALRDEYESRLSGRERFKDGAESEFPQTQKSYASLILEQIQVFSTNDGVEFKMIPITTSDFRQNLEALALVPEEILELAIPEFFTWVRERLHHMINKPDEDLVDRNGVEIPPVEPKERAFLETLQASIQEPGSYISLGSTLCVSSNPYDSDD